MDLLLEMLKLTGITSNQSVNSARSLVFAGQCDSDDDGGNDDCDCDCAC